MPEQSTPPHQTSSYTLADSLNTRNNALNFIRLLLALAVILHHSAIAGTFTGFAPHFMTAISPLGAWAVAGFFAISGYLITASKTRTFLLPYLWRRALRIYPGYWVMLIGTAFIFAPIAPVIYQQGDYHFSDGLHYVLANTSIFKYPPEYTIGTTLDGATFGAWNGSIWTLFFELSAYIATAILLIIPLPQRFRRLTYISLATFFCILAPLAKPVLNISTNTYLHALHLSAYFLSGAAVFFCAKKIRLERQKFYSIILVSTSALLFFTTAFLSSNAVNSSYESTTALVTDPWALISFFVSMISVPVWSLTVLLLGATLPITWCRDNDYSYGIYIWGMPVQQMVAMFFPFVFHWNFIDYTLYTLTCIGCVFPIAMLSWKLVEQPALSMKKLVPTHVTLIPQKK